ncbi:MAG: hypothetical protein M0D54_19810 [Hyphomonadaceae bacterium JAD_PAG50586_4]|nr:MAG: hypothetical protein M0D54_19810 [Hyphomonadaceae bacterium JAD_PAG50586_4]
MSRSLVALIVALLVLASGTRAVAQTSVAETSIRAIEDQMVMPRGAGPLELYSRYYAPDQLNGREVIVGVFLLRDALEETAHTGAVTVASIPNAFTMASRWQLPLVLDGGCSVVTIYFDLETQRLLPIQLEGVSAEPELGACNGLG